MALEPEHENDGNPTPEMGGKGAKPEPVSAADLAALREENERIKKALKDANREAAERRRKLDEIEAAEREKADAALPEIDKLNKRLAGAERDLSEKDRAIEERDASLNALRVEFAVYRAAAGKVNPARLDAVARLMDRDGLDIEDDGSVRGVDKAIDAVLKEYPEFAAAQRGAGTPPPPVHGGTPPRRPSGANGGSITPDQIRESLRATGSGGF